MNRVRALRAAVFAAACLPGLGLALGAARGALGVNPIETVTHVTGAWALRLLLVTLAVTPLRRLTGFQAVGKLRRMLGLFAFAYASLHFATWVGLEHFFDWAAMVEDVVERPYVTAGFAAFALLVPLAVTSTRGMIRRLGRRWVALHRLVYASAALAVLHYLWLVKADLRGPGVHAGVLGLLLGTRVWWRMRRSFEKG